MLGVFQPRALLAVAVVLLAGSGRARSGELDDALKAEDEPELCSRVFMLMLKHYGKDFDVSKCKEKDQAFILAYHAAGIIDNGGFQYLFEGNFKGDPHLARTAAAFKSVGADVCAGAVSEALKLFPDSKPPADVDKRLEIYQRVPEAKRQAIDRKFFKQSSDLSKLLAKYVRDNRDAFKHLQ